MRSGSDKTLKEKRKEGGWEGTSWETDCNFIHDS